MCKNKSTKRPVDRHNAILTTLSDFSSTIVQNFCALRLFRSKINLKIFWIESFLLPHIPLDTQNAVPKTLLSLLQNHPKLFWSKSENEKNKKQNVRKTIFLKLLIWTHRMPFRGTCQRFSDKSSNSFWPKTPKKNKQKLSGNKPSKCFSGPTKCNYDNAVRIFLSKHKHVLLKVQQWWKKKRVL